MSLVEKNHQEINFEALGLSEEEYNQLLKIQNDYDKSVSQQSSSHKDIKIGNDKKECQIEQNDEDKNLEKSILLLKDLLQKEGHSPEDIESMLKAFQNEKDLEFGIDNILKHNIHHEEEQKVDSRESEVNLPDYVKKILEEDSLAEIKKYQEDLKSEEESRILIDKMMAEELQEKENRNTKEEQDSENLIKKLLKEEEEKKEEAQPQTDCVICLDNLFSQAVFPLTNCRHLFHIECLETYVIEEIKKRTFPIRCPNPDCKAEIPEDDIKDTLQAHIEYQDIYDDYYIKHYVDSNPEEFYHCPTPDCKFVCYIEEGPRFNCPDCNKSYCIDCKTDWHNKLKCEEYQKLKRDQGDDVFERFADQMRYRRCPKCKVYVERIEGCDAMNCTRCHTPFCYKCGREGDGHRCNHEGGVIFPIRRPNPRPIRRKDNIKKSGKPKYFSKV